MAFGGAVHLLDIGVRDFVQADMAVFTLEFSVNRAGILLLVNVIDTLLAGLIVPAHVGIAMAQQAVFRIGTVSDCEKTAAAGVSSNKIAARMKNRMLLKLIGSMVILRLKFFGATAGP